MTQYGLQKKTIDSIIRGRINNWIFSFNRLDCFKDIIDIQNTEEATEDDKKAIASFGNDILNSVIVSGGAIASMLLGEEINDLDIYFNDKEVARKVARYYLNTAIIDGNLKETEHVRNIELRDTTYGGVDIFIRSQGVTGDGIDTEKYQYFEMFPPNLIDKFFEEFNKKAQTRKEEQGKRFGVSFITSNAITLNNDIQIILRFCGSPEEIHSNFDFVHATNYWTSKDGVSYNAQALEAILERRLYYVGSKFPVSTVFRLRKFIERGWRISAGEMMKIAFDVSKLDLTNVQVLRDQTIGMDSAYFRQVIFALEEKSVTDIDRTYLFTIINQIFNESDKVNLDDNGEVVVN